MSMEFLKSRYLYFVLLNFKTISYLVLYILQIESRKEKKGKKKNKHGVKLHYQNFHIFPQLSGENPEAVLKTLRTRNNS